ncbi:MipA/OmpV family protein [Sphaerotilus sp.]|uniref:MipA/OmpV family protein n=1 Tax=Sphaerotilus sp. TaxID=2093942 RepID=UPI002ACDF62A|nr:MipA/OmpV family protein [Sphaerotilus sp.]MDZ7854607.1 MipA/OmpV family protein [Sphaerotilus sp.]
MQVSRFLRRHARVSLPLATACFTAIPAAAESQVAALPLWEIGGVGVGVSQQAYPGSDQQVTRGLALPYLVYRGQFLRADRETAGLRAFKTPNAELDIGVSGSFGARSDDIEARRGMPDLGTLVEFGPRIKWNLGAGPGGGAWRLDLPLRGVFDLNARGHSRGIAFEPRLVFQRRSSTGWGYTTSVSAIVADQRLARTFYGVDPVHALAGRPAYEARSGLVAWRLSASLSRSLSRDWRILGFGRLDTVSGAANEHSPLVKRTHGASVGLGLSYTWMRSDETASD